MSDPAQQVSSWLATAYTFLGGGVSLSLIGAALKIRDAVNAMQDAPKIAASNATEIESLKTALVFLRKEQEATKATAEAAAREAIEAIEEVEDELRQLRDKFNVTKAIIDDRHERDILEDRVMTPPSTRRR